ncbi:serine hydrolase [Streptomyces sp. NPDC051578]|uniref:D-alanyl-D-alanine carboxypeptidase n=1 Tax=Streptomyces sp. NPDC051578 TaxID=3365662 RepID=UPI0037AB9323
MKAKTVAGGPQGDPRLQGTTTRGKAPDRTREEPDTVDVTGADRAPEEGGAGVADGEPEAVEDTAQQETDGGGDVPGVSAPAESAPAAGGAEAGARGEAEHPPVECTDGPGSEGGTEAKTGRGADGTHVLAAPARTADEPEDDTEADGAAAASPAAVPPPPGAEPTAPDAPAESDEPEGAAGPTIEAEPDDTPTSPTDAGEAEARAEEEAEKEAATTAGTKVGEEADEKAEERTDGKADETAVGSAGTKAVTTADGTLTSTEPTSEEAKTGAAPASTADPADAGQAGDAGDSGEDTRTVTFRAPDTAATARQPEADAAADTSRGGSETHRGPSREARPPFAGEADAAAGDEPDARSGRSVPSPNAETAPGNGGRKAPAWARREEGGPERTSQFAALKPLDASARATARPDAAPHAHPTTSPRAPLDLLAELTNTPAPPETPRRTALRRVKVWTPILLLLVGAYTGAQLLRPLPSPRIVAAERQHTADGQFSVPWPAKGQGAVRVSGSGDVGTFGEQKPVPMASVAKVMTAYVILKGHPLRKNDPGPDITIDAKAVADGNSDNESRIQGLAADTKFSQQDILKMLMIKSGNNAARLLARWDTGSDSEAAFVEKMNAAARELGMRDTTYTDPSGLDAGTVSTAADQLKLAEAVMKDEVFRTIVAIPSAPIKGLPDPLINNNDLLSVQGLSVRGIKTGSSTPAGGALMWAAYKSVGDETPLILGTLMEQRVDGPDPNAANSLALVLANSKRIIEAVRTALASTTLIRKGDTVGYVDDGLGGRTPLVATKDLNVIGVPGQQFELTLAAGSSPLPHVAKAGTEVGALTAGDGAGAKRVPVAVRRPLSEPSLTSRLTRLR